MWRVSLLVEVKPESRLEEEVSNTLALPEDLQDCVSVLSSRLDSFFFAVFDLLLQVVNVLYNSV
jgi:hypothetical protein